MLQVHKTSHKKTNKAVAVKTVKTRAADNGLPYTTLRYVVSVTHTHTANLTVLLVIVLLCKYSLSTSRFDQQCVCVYRALLTFMNMISVYIIHTIWLTCDLPPTEK
jgi:hypothetical protein